MKINQLKDLLKDKRVVEEINKHLWIESQKSGYSIGIERATDEWLRFYAEGWMKYNDPEKFQNIALKNKKQSKVFKKKEKSVKRAGKKLRNK